MTEGRVGIQIGATTSPTSLPAVAATAESLGYAEAWLAEDYFELGGIASAASALGATKAMPVGLGVVAAAVRHPAVAAMEFATLAGAHPARFKAGLGHGAPGWVRQMGLEPSSPMTLLREAVVAIRTLLDGGRFTSDGRFFQCNDIALLHKPSDRVPLYLGVHGPASLRLSGELADGTLLGWFSSAGYVRWARARIDEGRERAGRDDQHDLIALCLLALSDDDPAAARRDLAAWASPIASGMTDSPLFDSSETAIGEPDDMLTGFVASGSSEQCLETVTGLLDAGADRVVVVPNPGGRLSTAAMVDQIELAAAAFSLSRGRQATPRDSAEGRGA